jgi:hypothetical protein
MAILETTNGRIRLSVADVPSGVKVNCGGVLVHGLLDLGRALKKLQAAEDERMFQARGNTD